MPICRLPSVTRCAAVVARLLAPGGRPLVRDVHPFLATLDEHTLAVRHPWFETSGPLEFDDDSSYVATARPLTATVTHEWNHGLGEIVTALLDQGLTLTGLTEHRTVPWEALPGRMAGDDDGEWHVTDGLADVPLSFTVQATR